MNRGDLVKIVPDTNYPYIGWVTRGYHDCPLDNSDEWIEWSWIGPSVGILLENRFTYWKVLVEEREFWIDHYRLEKT